MHIRKLLRMKKQKDDAFLASLEAMLLEHTNSNSTASRTCLVQLSLDTLFLLLVLLVFWLHVVFSRV